MGHEPFGELVKRAWSRAVSAAAASIGHYRPELLEALGSDDADIRSAAVAALNEGGDSGAHDEVMGLMNDPESAVRREVAEYLQDYARAGDAKAILGAMERYPALLPLLSKALQRITGREDGLIDGEAPPKQIRKELSLWRSFLAERGLLE